jgi:hypothetical protein
MLNLSDKTKIWELLKGGISLAEVEWQHGKSGSSIHNTVLKSMHPEHLLFSSVVVSLEPYTHPYQEFTIMSFYVYIL